MRDFLQDTIESLWPGNSPAPQPASTAGMGAEPGFRPARTPAETKAEHTTRVAREIIDEATKERSAKTAELRRARLKKEAQE